MGDVEGKSIKLSAVGKDVFGNVKKADGIPGHCYAHVVKDSPADKYLKKYDKIRIVYDYE